MKTNTQTKRNYENISQEYSYTSRWELLINGYPAANTLPLSDKNIHQNHEYMTKRNYVLAGINHWDTIWTYPEYFKQLSVKDGEERKFTFNDDWWNLIEYIYVKALSPTFQPPVVSSMENVSQLIQKILPFKSKRWK